MGSYHKVKVYIFLGADHWNFFFSVKPTHEQKLLFSACHLSEHHRDALYTPLTLPHRATGGD